MKKLDFDQMARLSGGKDTDCSTGERLTKIAVAGATGAIGGPFGFLAGLVGGLAYDAYVCGWK